VSRVKTTEPIEMPFGLWTQVGPRNHVLDRDSDPPYQGAILRSKGVARSKISELSAVSCAKTAEPIETPFGMLSGVDPRKHLLDGVQIPHV